MSEEFRNEKYDTQELNTDEYGDGFNQQDGTDNQSEYIDEKEPADKNQQNDKKKAIIIAVVSAVIVIAIIVATVLVINGFSRPSEEEPTESLETTETVKETKAKVKETTVQVVTKIIPPATNAPAPAPVTTAPQTEPVTVAPTTQAPTEPPTEAPTEPDTEVVQPVETINELIE